MESNEAVGHEEDCDEGVLVDCWEDDWGEERHELEMENLEEAVARYALRNLFRALKIFQLFHDKCPGIRIINFIM